MNITYKKTRLVIILGICTLILIYPISGIIGIIKEGMNALSIKKGIIHTIPDEYGQLFNPNIKISELSNKYTYLSTIRFPISNFDYDGKYSVIVTKVNFGKDISLRKAIVETYHSSEISKGIGYLGIPQIAFSFDYLTVPLQPAGLFLNLEGNSITTITKNDTIAEYYLKMRNLSLQYKKDGLIDLAAKAKRNNIPVSVVFIKRKNYVYIIIVSVNYYDTRMSSTVADELMNIRH